jgi:hypothetical protein
MSDSDTTLAEYVYLAERPVPAMTTAELEAVETVLVAASRRLTASGSPVRLLRTTYLPTGPRWTATFSARHPESVHRAIEIAQLPPVQLTALVSQRN